jgi:hypothetical protein
MAPTKEARLSRRHSRTVLLQGGPALPATRRCAGGPGPGRARRGRSGGQRSSVPGREHLRFQVRQHPDRPPSHLPVPGRVPRRAGDLLAGGLDAGGLSRRERTIPCGGSDAGKWRFGASRASD